MAKSLLYKGLGVFKFSNLVKLYPAVTTTRYYREIKVTEEGKTTTIEGLMHEDDNSKYLSPDNPYDTCPIRSRGLQVTYEDVLILRQFITSTGEILPQNVTGLCDREHLKMTANIKMAQRANLLPGTECQLDDYGNEVPKLNRYLTRHPIGSQTPMKKRGPIWKRRFYKLGNSLSVFDAPRISNKRLNDSH